MTIDSPPQSATPPANVYESSGELSVAVPLPGAHANHVQVIVRPDNLRVEAACKYPQSRQNYLRRDWLVGSWNLDLQLPRPIDPQRARATLNLGVLVVMAPIAEGGGDAERRVPVDATAEREATPPAGPLD